MEMSESVSAIKQNGTSGDKDSLICTAGLHINPTQVQFYNQILVNIAAARGK